MESIFVEWECTHCTYKNQMIARHLASASELQKRNRTECQLCGLPRTDDESKCFGHNTQQLDQYGQGVRPSPLTGFYNFAVTPTPPRLIPRVSVGPRSAFTFETPAPENPFASTKHSAQMAYDLMTSSANDWTRIEGEDEKSSAEDHAAKVVALKYELLDAWQEDYAKYKVQLDFFANAAAKLALKNFTQTDEWRTLQIVWSELRMGPNPTEVCVDSVAEQTQKARLIQRQCDNQIKEIYINEGVINLRVKIRTTLESLKTMKDANFDDYDRVVNGADLHPQEVTEHMQAAFVKWKDELISSSVSDLRKWWTKLKSLSDTNSDSHEAWESGFKADGLFVVLFDAVHGCLAPDLYNGAKSPSRASFEGNELPKITLRSSVPEVESPREPSRLVSPLPGSRPLSPLPTAPRALRDRVLSFPDPESPIPIPLPPVRQTSSPRPFPAGEREPEEEKTPEIDEKAWEQVEGGMW